MFNKPFKTGFWFGLGFIGAYYLIKIVGMILFVLLMGGPIIPSGINYIKCIL